MITWKPILICAVALGAIADPINVGYYASGSAGDWTLNFQVDNNLAGAPDQDLYLFGVALSAPDVVGSPAGYDPTAIPTWDNSGLGGSSTLYNNVWLDASVSQLLPGSMLSGFEVHVSDLTLPQTVQWFAFTSGSTAYTGGGNFGDPFNPGFEGLATNLPEANAGAMLAGVLAGFLLLRRRRHALIACFADCRACARRDPLEAGRQAESLPHRVAATPHHTESILDLHLLG